MSRQLIVAILIVGFGAVCAGDDKRDPITPKNPTLMGSLPEWMYPGSTFAGAQMSDGGNRTITSVNCQAKLTTGDPFEKVVGYYERTFVSGPSQRGAGSDVVQAQSVSSQDDSSKRPLQLRVIVVNRAMTSTTLVISRAANETQTHIAWSHFQNTTADR
jgi:hypothetical protein